MEFSRCSQSANSIYVRQETKRNEIQTDDQLKILLFACTDSVTVRHHPAGDGPGHLPPSQCKGHGIITHTVLGVPMLYIMVRDLHRHYNSMAHATEIP